ncbi:DeoR/GlpR family DNA-binding transcription regulator [Cryobacterium sp. TMS1-20-1]|uniref:DeoR/GlpR family DNA-binding transcription regulator n=1 Tax=Cryobacterium sp. TMS1-20-1 TaxID=1259223 RepID=UPI00351A8B5C
MSTGLDSMTSRQVSIMNLLQKSGFVSTSELAESFSVSEMTIRRDTRQLASGGLVRVVHGGVSLVNPAGHNADFAARARIEAEAKHSVALACLGLVGSRDAIIIDAGTTTFQIINEMPIAFEGTVITNSAPAIQRCLQMTKARTICLGGELLLDSQAFTGPMTRAAVEGLRAQIAFIGVSGVHENSFYIERDVERPTKLALMEAAEQVVVVATHDKINRSALVRLMDFSSVDILVTDAPPPADIRQALRAAAVELIIAKSPTGGAGRPN